MSDTNRDQEIEQLRSEIGRLKKMVRHRDRVIAQVGAAVSSLGNVSSRPMTSHGYQ
jgi:hypothetical protein